MRNPALILIALSLALGACESANQPLTADMAKHETSDQALGPSVPASPTTPDIAFVRVPDCVLKGGGVDGWGEVVPTARKHGAAIRIEGIFTLCTPANEGIWFKVYSFVDDGTQTGHRILLASDHNPVVLRQRTDSSGETATSWQINIDFIPSALPLVEPNHVQPRVMVEAYGRGGKIGEVFCYLDENPDAGPRGPRRGGN
jgi:hypothetical protein